MQLLFFHARRLVRMRIFRVGVIGIIGLVIQTAIFEILGIYLGIVRPSTAAVIGGEVAILCNFFLNQRFSFRDHKDTGNVFIRLLRFHMVVAGSLFLQWLFVFTAEHMTTDVLFIRIAYFGGVAAGFITNYTGYYFFVWKQHRKDPSY